MRPCWASIRLDHRYGTLRSSMRALLPQTTTDGNDSGVESIAESLPVNANSRSVTAGAAAERGGSGAVRRPHRADPGALARRELVVARVVRVVHVVVDRVQ